ncbi:MAG: (2Fe-2S)-binding protein [Verrucomicrobia bacterium]|nr:(2Fe-2S)-binding protein [Verrucomicrobiota bacterium]
MPKVTILPVDLTAEVPAGDSLLDAGHAAGVPMEAGCFNCSCGTCAVEIVSGMGNLSPVSAAETEVLRANDCDPSRFRLACTARVQSGEVVLRQLD